MTGPRFDLAPLAALSGVPLSSLGKRLNLSGTTWKEARDNGVGLVAAERYAVRLGLHPAIVWPEWLDASTERVSVPCAECQEPYVPTRKGHVYCSPRCKNRRLQRVKYQNDNAFRERKLREVAAYYEEAGEYVRGRMRRRHFANRDAELERMRAAYQRRKAQGSDGTVAA